LKESIKKVDVFISALIAYTDNRFKKNSMCIISAYTYSLINNTSVSYHTSSSSSRQCRRQVSYSIYIYAYTYTCTYTEKKLLDKAVFSTVLVILYIWRNKRCYEYGIYKEFQCTQKKVYIIVISKYISSFVRNKKRRACVYVHGFLYFNLELYIYKSTY